MNAIGKNVQMVENELETQMIENSINENAEIGRMYSKDLLWHVFEEASLVEMDALKEKDPELWKLVDDTAMLQRVIDAKDNDTLDDREAETLITLIPEISHLVEVIKAR